MKVLWEDQEWEVIQSSVSGVEITIHVKNKHGQEAVLDYDEVQPI